MLRFHTGYETLMGYTEELGVWQLPKPTQSKEWTKIVRLTKRIPFGYKLDPTNDRILLPVINELEALELAKKHLKQYSYRVVAQWLSKETNRPISHMGLKKRVEVEHKRRKASVTKRKLAKWLEETLAEIEKLETQGVGAYAEASGDRRPPA